MTVILTSQQERLLDELRQVTEQPSTRSQRKKRAITTKYLRENEKNIHVIGRFLKQEGRNEELRLLQNFTNNLFSAKKLGDKAPDFYKKINANWMANLPAEVKQNKLSSLILPGTHDSGAYKINYGHTSGKWWWAGLGARIGGFLGINRFIKKWTLTQDYDIYKQLEQGVRSLDLRVSYNKSDKKFYISHSFACIPLNNALRDIKRFMEKNPEEILLIHMKPDWEHRRTIPPKVGDKLLAQYNKILGDLLVNRQSNNPDKEVQKQEFENFTLQQMVNSNSRILLANQCRFSADSPHAQSSWGYKVIQRQWLHTSKKEEAMQKIEETLSTRLATSDTNLPSQHFQEIGFTLTPDSAMVKKSAKRQFIPFGKYIFKENSSEGSLRALAQEMNKEIKPVLDTYKQRAESEHKDISCLGNIIPLDYVGRSDAVDEIVSLNYKI